MLDTHGFLTAPHHEPKQRLYVDLGSGIWDMESGMRDFGIRDDDDGDDVDGDDDDDDDGDGGDDDGWC